MSLVDWTALGIVLLYGALLGLREYYAQIPQSGFLFFLAICAAIYWLVRGWVWARDHLLWSLRNRLVAAYVFIAVVPVLLLLAMAGLAAYLLYWQLGSYVIYTEMEEREERVGVVATAMATSYAAEATFGRTAAALALPVAPDAYIKNAMTELPGLKVETGTGEELLHANGPSGGSRFRGLVFSDGQLALRGVVARQTPTGRILVSVVVPMTPELIDTLAPELGPIQFNVLRPESDSTKSPIPIVINTEKFASVEQIGTLERAVPKAANPFDKLITGIVSLDALDLDQKQGQSGSARVFATFSTRPSLLNRRLFSPLGDLGGAAATALLVVGAVFLLIEIGSLVTGIVLTRTITTAVDSLYSATQHVQEGDLTFRVRLPHRDQLAALGESFNSMMQSVSTLIEEQRQRQKLENELSIAHEVQQQLFPRSLPDLRGIEIEAICRPARVVSGDYYDFIRISPARLAIALADISGKGISAALLMANVQAALRSDVLRYRDGHSGIHHEQIDTAEIVSHLNLHLFRNTSDERYATCFFGVYDSETRQLHYTNAGHLPPIYICGSKVRRLETGGMVVGLFNDVPFQQGAVEIEHGGILVAYSDGLIEPENVYGEEFGSTRLVDVATRYKDASSHEIAEAMVRAAEEWSGSPEQADDMTVIVMRFSGTSEEKRS
ncbi:MAG TPA: SpoIIE family protein phosphatase [Candidatus Acidoferrales bacterium]|jgi:sigma-B regulation protein RsbU (phosphoserine phosphatase)|nr:SpoIIE family protein phosphatase [Candidatus Acidoferrales bacterium]